MQYADVAFNLPLKKTFQYRVPEAFEWEVGVGCLVEASFNRRQVVGCVTGLASRPHPELEGKRILPVQRVVTPGFHIPKPDIELAEWIADYYYCGPGEALQCVSMIGFNEARARKLKWVRLVEPAAWRARREEDDKQWRALGAVQRRLIDTLLAIETAALPRPDLLEAADADAGAIQRLARRGIIEETELDGERPDAYAALDTRTSDAPLDLNHHQRRAFEEIRAALDARRFEAFLLHGVTGSGKTEVYLQAIARTLGHERQAIVLVPEIALTPQTVERFRRRFGDRVGVYHSGLSIGQKFDLWRSIESGAVSVLVGARSALFAPFRTLGLIVIDEEHENAYKQSEPAPRYHARDVAIVRARQRGAVAILGSATPSLESYFNAAEAKKYTLLHLPERISQLPASPPRLVDMGEEAALRQNTDLLSKPLTDALAERLARGEQSILFLNRRGFSNFQVCFFCRHTPQCTRCDVPLTYHKGLDRLVCHYCDRSSRPHETCPNCGSEEMHMVGMGTERIETILEETLPEARVLRLDLDTTGSKDAFIKAWRRITRGDVDIILGTQMIAKGLHLENVTLVGVVSADFALFQPDFRAAERAFSLLTQVTGRTGRGAKLGEVIIQTYQPRHYSIAFAVRQDYEGFYQREIQARRLLRFPPHNRLIALLVSDQEADRARSAARRLAELVKRIAVPHRPEGLTILGATPAPIARLRGRHRWQILMRGPNPGQMRGVLNVVLKEWLDSADNARVGLTVDVDPVDLL